MISKLVTINAAKTAAVNQSMFWIPIDENTPVGVKLLLINRKFGVTTQGQYYKDSDWTHWQGMPKFMEDSTDGN